MSVSYRDPVLRDASTRGYEKFVSVVINNRNEPISMPKDPVEAMAWSQGMLQACSAFASRLEDAAYRRDLVSQLLGESND